jgi:cephalosporin-C deacetylase
MPLFDMPIEQLRSYAPDLNAPADLSDFWARALAEARQVPMRPRFEETDGLLPGIRAWDCSFPGYGGQDVKAWFILPSAKAVEGLPPGYLDAQGRLPCVVEYIGYGGGRGFPLNWLAWPAAGFAFLVMDTRGQGSVWLNGDTPDPEPEGSNPQQPGFMTRGILDPEKYYYKRVYVDGVRAVEAALCRPEVDPGRVFVTGGSQGGAITLAVASLLGGPSGLPAPGGTFRLAGAMPEVPFLCHFRRAVEIAGTDPYLEILRYLKCHRDKIDQAFSTLAYFDNVNLVPWARAEALFSVALMDDICPPSTVFAAYNRYGGAAGPAKDIKVYPFNNHEAGQHYHLREKIAFAQERALRRI